jgi:hypothetical protein
MIAHFPTPHPDELLYSLYARYCDRVQYWSKGAISLELLGAKDLTATIDLPSRLGYLVSNLPEGHSLLLDRLIDEHTLLPFYSPFLEKDRVERLRREMEGVGGGAVHKIAAITPSTIRPPNHLRFCPLCVEDDRQEFEECYWHRLHQLPGVLVCCKHKCFLENSEVRTRNRVTSYAYISAEQAKLQDDVRPLDMADISHRCLMFISQSAQWLLSQRSLAPGYDSLHSYYMKDFDAKGLVYGGRFLHASKLPEAIRYRYPKAMLTAIQCDFDEAKEYCWPSKLVKELKLRKANHPLRHLLFIGLLGQTPKSFFRTPKADETDDGFTFPKQCSTYKHLLCRKIQKAALHQGTHPVVTPKIACPPGALRQSKLPFGIGPWPCLNLVCDFYLQPVITSCKVAKHWEDRTIVVGFFSCACGFTYRRSGPDKSLTDQLRLDSIKTYGEVWIEQLRRLWDDLTLSMHKMGSLLGVAHTTVKGQAVSLGLKFPRYGPGSKIAYGGTKRYRSKGIRKRIKRQRTEMPTPREDYRREMHEAIEYNPTATRTILAKQLASQAYRWLQKHDEEWLEAHLPPPVKLFGSNRKVDWTPRDARLAEDVHLIAKQLRSGEGHPVRVTLQRISRELDKTALLDGRKLHLKLPRTAQVLSEVTETHMAFAIRCVRWAASCYRCEGAIPSVSALAKRAGMTMTTTHRPEIRAVINEELVSLRNADGICESKVA